MQTYCVSDVDILRRASLKFRHLLLSATGEEILEKDHFENGVFSTIASVCMGVFRYLHLEETYEVKLTPYANNGTNLDGDWLEASKRGKDEFLVKKSTGWCKVDSSAIAEKKVIKFPMGVIPSSGYGGVDNYSKISIEWLEWEAKRRGIKIQHALNGGEERIQKPDGFHYKVDSFYTDPHTDQKTVFEFNGCWNATQKI